MINKKILLLAFTLVLFASCKKTYKCECTNSNGSYEAGEVEGTKKQAQKHCQNLSSGSTTCDVK
ncbi:MAG: hypothetical protein KA163_13980 [Bacteroidia bacterium]|nr:hypothetical protein [Bacteroidia bacterium]